MEEPKENDELIVNRLKEFSGDAVLKTRGLYQNACDFMPQFGLIFVCNEIPKISKVEYAIARL
jgi:phage/plasmid-associated DNA primase